VKNDDDVIVVDDEGNPRWINCCSIGRYRGIDGKHPKIQAKYDYYEAHPSMDMRKGRKRNDEIRRLYNKLTHGEKGNLSCFALTGQAMGEFTRKDKKFWKGRGKRGNVARMNLCSWIYNHVVLPHIFSTEKQNYSWEEDKKKWKEDDNFSVRARTGFEKHRNMLERMIGQVYERKKDKFVNEVKDDSDDDGKTRAGGGDDDDDDEEEDDEETEDEDGEDSEDDHSNSD
jgi:hypothetical protein